MPRRVDHWIPGYGWHCPATFKNCHGDSVTKRSVGFRRSGDGVLGATHAEWCMEIVKGGRLGPIPSAEVINVGLTEEVTAGVGVRFDGPASAADVACALGVAPFIPLEEVDFVRWPDDAAVQSGLPTPSVRATTSCQPPVDDVEL